MIFRFSLAFLAAVVLGSPALARGERFDADVSTYAAIDAAFEGEILIPLGATWRYFPGVEEPSPELEWTQPDFDDSAWSEGPSPIGFGHDDNATRLDDLPSAFTTVYLRGVLEIADPGIYEAIRLRMPIDDGYVVYLDGTEQGRLHAWYPGTRMAHDETASSERGVDLGPTPHVDLTHALHAGANTLAIQGLVYAGDADTLSVRPTLWAGYRADPAAEEARVAALEALLDGEEDGARLAYARGRRLQRQGRFPAAAALFLEAAELDPEAREPWTRLVECRRAEGSLAELEAELRGRVAEGAFTATMLDVWARLLLEDLGGSPTDLPALAPADAELPRTGYFADALWAGGEWLAGRWLRIDCGADTEHAIDGIAWSRDRFFARGRAVRLPPDEGAPSDELAPYDAARVASQEASRLAPAYRVPLPRGLYELRLHLVGETAVDVHLEGALVVRGHDPDDGIVAVPVGVRDGLLEIDLLPRTSGAPRIAALEVEPVELERFDELARSWSERVSWSRAFPIVQLAEARLEAGERREALDLFEQAARLPDFLPADRERLSALRDELLPDLLSCATADDLATRRRGEAKELLALVTQRARSVAHRSRAAARDDNASACALYFEGRVHQEAGRLDEAIVAFEELVFSGRKEPEPVLRMAECLVESELLPEAEGVLREALFGGVPATPELLRLWLALNLGELERDPWDVVADLRELDVPDVLVVSPTAEAVARSWQYTTQEPPATTWSRSTFDASTWRRGPGAIGTGLVAGAVVRSPWNTHIVYARRGFELPGGKLLYPYLRTAADDACDVYLNGTLVTRINDRTDGYALVPVRRGAFNEGENVLGLYGLNVRGPGCVDVGAYEPLGELVWILTELEERGAIRVNCGGPEYESADGVLWSADRFQGHARSYETDETTEIDGTDDDVLYRTHSWYRPADQHAGWYRVPLPDGDYAVTLHFAEIVPELSEAGSRVFDVLLEGHPVLEKHDVTASAGARTAQRRRFEVRVEDGWLDVDLRREVKERLLGAAPFLSALEIERP